MMYFVQRTGSGHVTCSHVNQSLVMSIKSITPFPHPLTVHHLHPKTKTQAQDATTRRREARWEREHKRDDDEGGDGHDMSIPRKGTFFIYFSQSKVLTPSLPSLAVPPSPFDTPNMKNAPVGRVFRVWLVRLHPEPPSSSQTRS